MSILPLSFRPCLPHHQGMNTSDLLQIDGRGPVRHGTRLGRRTRRRAIRSLRAHSHGAAAGAKTLLLCEPDPPHWLKVRTNRTWSRVLTRVLAPWLDRLLADGRRPESSFLLAARAQVIVSPAERQSLAYDWTDVLAQVRTPRGFRDPRVPINRDDVLANERGIRNLIDALVASTPGQVRGIAVMRRLLTDGAGPLYNPHCSDSLRDVVGELAALLDPWAV
jgi:hypothetical protein